MKIAQEELESPEACTYQRPHSVEKPFLLGLVCFKKDLLPPNFVPSAWEVPSKQVLGERRWELEG